MTDKISENKVTTESETGSNGVGHSKVQSFKGEVKASPEELVAALESSQKTIQALQSKLTTLEAKTTPAASDDSFNKLISALTTAITNNNKPVGPQESDNINRSTDFTKRQMIDGNSMMEAQAALMSFRNEEKMPVSIPKTFVSQFGPALPVSVNGVRVSIPCDGKTYYINKTHAEAARERMAKVDRLLAENEPQIIETNS